MVILVKRKPLSRQQFLALRQRILRKDSSSAANTINDASELKDNQNDDKTNSSATPTEEASQKQQDNTHLLQEQEEKRKKLREERNEISRQLASLESKLASLKEEKHHLFQQLKQALHEDEQKRQLQHDQKIREQQQQQATIEATPTNLPLQQQPQPQPLLPQLQDQHQKQQQQASRPPQDQQQKLVSMPTGIKRPRNDSDELAGSHDYMSSQPHKRPPLLSNPPMMTYHPQGFPQQQQQQQQQQQPQQPNFNNPSFNKANNYQGFEPHPQQPFHAVDMSYQQPRFPMQEPNHMITSQSDQRFVFQGRPPLNNEMSENYRPQFPNQMHHGGQQMEFGNQSYGQEFSSQQPHLMGYGGNRPSYKHSLLEHTTTGPTSNCSSPSSLHSPITNLSMPASVAGAPFSPHEPSPVFQMGMGPAPPFSHDQQKTSSKQPRNNAL